MRSPLRRPAAFVLALVGATLLASPSAAQSAADFPNKPITLIMSWPAGTGIDLWHRAMGEAVAKALGQPVIVDNRTGASGTAGPASMAAAAKPDGYTIAHIPITIFRLPAMQKVSFDPLKDFSYIIHVSGFLFGTAVRADSQFKSFQDMVAWSRDNPGELTYGTPGAGTSLHLGMEQIAAREGVKWTMVPFKGGSETWAAVEGGHVMAAAEGAGWWPLLDAGRVRILALWSETRNPRLPDTPTLKELGYPFVFDSPFGLAGPKGMDPAHVQKLHDAFKKALEDPAVIESMRKYDMFPRYMNTADYTKFVGEVTAQEKAALELIGLLKKD
jgi:tripartite-type tricarboxylate transporter receptor subunit TctC